MFGIVESVVGVAGKVLDKFVADKDLKAKLEAEFKTQLISLDLAQAQTNLELDRASCGYAPSLWLGSSLVLLLQLGLW